MLVLPEDFLHDFFPSLVHAVYFRQGTWFQGLVLVYYYTVICNVTITSKWNFQIGLTRPAVQGVPIKKKLRVVRGAVSGDTWSNERTYCNRGASASGEVCPGPVPGLN